MEVDYMGDAGDEIEIVLCKHVKGLSLIGKFNFWVELMRFVVKEF